MIYAVIDTNVFVAALLSRHSDSATVQVVDTLLARGICPLYNQEIINEYQDVLHRDKFHFPSATIDAYEVALSKEDAYLVTGNKKHFPQKPIVVTPAEMMEILYAEEVK